MLEVEVTDQVKSLIKWEVEITAQVGQWSRLVTMGSMIKEVTDQCDLIDQWEVTDHGRSSPLQYSISLSLFSSLSPFCHWEDACSGRSFSPIN